MRDGPDEEPPGAADVHAVPARVVAERLATDAAAGLASDEAASRLAAYGANELEHGEQLSRARILLAQLTSPMILLLAVAGALSAALGDVTEAVVIFVVVVLNAWIGFRQEYRAEKAMAALQAMATPTAGLSRRTRCGWRSRR
jgi:Ca2+-transporting ATPase